MESNRRTVVAIYNATTDKNVTHIYFMGLGLIFVKDFLPDGTPCWRQPTREETMQFEKERNKNEI